MEEIALVLILVVGALVALIVEIKRLHDALRPLLDSRVVAAISAV